MAKKSKNKDKEETKKVTEVKPNPITIKSTFRTINIKFYNEQLPGGHDKLFEKIKNHPSDHVYIMCAYHNKDVKRKQIEDENKVVHYSFFETEEDKEHYHVIAKVINGVMKVGTILKILGIEFRPNEDETLLQNKDTIASCSDFGACVCYLTHDTKDSAKEMKAHYSEKNIATNIPSDVLFKYRNAGTSEKRFENVIVTAVDLETKREEFEKYGYELNDLDELLYRLDYKYRTKPLYVSQLKEAYQYGMRKWVEDHQYICRCTIFITGAGNTGKTYNSREALKSLDLKYRELTASGSGIFDYVTPDVNALLINDIVPPNVLNYADNCPVYLHRRHRGSSLWTGNFCIITSNLSFEDWCHECHLTKSQISAARSRMYICHIEKYELVVDQSQARGLQDSKHDHDILFNKFYKAYNDSSTSYYCS